MSSLLVAQLVESRTHVSVSQNVTGSSSGLPKTFVNTIQLYCFISLAYFFYLTYYSVRKENLANLLNNNDQVFFLYLIL